MRPNPTRQGKVLAVSVNTASPATTYRHMSTTKRKDNGYIRQQNQQECDARSGSWLTLARVIIQSFAELETTDEQVAYRLQISLNWVHECRKRYEAWCAAVQGRRSSLLRLPRGKEADSAFVLAAEVVGCKRLKRVVAAGCAAYSSNVYANGRLTLSARDRGRRSSEIKDFVKWFRGQRWSGIELAVEAYRSSCSEFLNRSVLQQIGLPKNTDLFYVAASDGNSRAADVKCAIIVRNTEHAETCGRLSSAFRFVTVSAHIVQPLSPETIDVLRQFNTFGCSVAPQSVFVFETQVAY